MEQWQHYGQQWLDTQAPAAPASLYAEPAAPAYAQQAVKPVEPVQQPQPNPAALQPEQSTSAPASAELQSLLDDLDF